MTYAWMIDKDYYPDNDSAPGTLANAAGVTGPRGARPPLLAQLAQGGGHRFRLVDDDDEVLYEGLFVGDLDSEEGFGPLDDFGEPNAGCTSIEYLVGDQWETI